MNTKNSKIVKTTFFLILIFLSFTTCDKEKYTYQDELNALNKYISDNNITTQPKSSGLYYIETKAGTGVKAQSGLYVSIRYKGYFLDGTVFDQNLDDAEPFTFVLGYGNVISGWDEGIGYMRDGGKATLIIPSSLAYWSTGRENIPPYTTLIFEVEVVNVE